VLAFRSEAATTGEKDIKQQLDMQQLQEALKQIQTERDVRLIFIISSIYLFIIYRLANVALFVYESLSKNK